MKPINEDSSNVDAQGRDILDELDQLIGHLRRDISEGADPRYQALLETSAEVLNGVKTAFEHHAAKSEGAWQAPQTSGRDKNMPAAKGVLVAGEEEHPNQNETAGRNPANQTTPERLRT